MGFHYGLKVLEYIGMLFMCQDCASVYVMIVMEHAWAFSKV